MSRNPLRRRLGAALVAALFPPRCSSSGSSGSGGDATLVAYVGQAGDYQVNFNPYSSSVIEAPGTIFESLFYFNVTKDAPPQPLLGTDYAWNASGTELSISLRPGV